MNGYSAPFIPPGQQQHQQEEGEIPPPSSSTTTHTHTPPTWAELGRYADDAFPITATAFDPIEELLWTGSARGRLSAFTQPTMHKYVSVLAHPELPVRQIRCFVDGVISISASEIKMHNRHCLAICAAPAKAMLGQEKEEKEGQGDNDENGGGNSNNNKNKTTGASSSPTSSASTTTKKITGEGNEPEEFTCGALNMSNTGMPHLAAYETGEHLTVGGSKNNVWQLDLMTGLTVLRTVEVNSPTSCMESNRAIIAGGRDGRLRFIDGMLRSRHGVERELDAYTGPVTSLCTWGDLVVATGMQGRSLNPYDRSGLAPTRYLSDPLIKVFDLRMMRQTLPLSFAPAMAAPNLLSYLPGKDKDRLLVASGSTGQFLLCDPFNVTAADTDFFQVMSHDTRAPGGFACVCVSGSGEMLAFGTHEGEVVEWAQDAEAVVNIPTQPLEHVPLLPPPPPTPIPPNDPTPASHYLLRPIYSHLYTHTQNPLLDLSSSFSTTPSVYTHLPIRHPPHRHLNPQLLSKMSVQDFLGYVPNTHTHYPLNSLLFGEARKDAYIVVDPRRKGEAGGDEEDWHESHTHTHGYNEEGEEEEGGGGGKEQEWGDVPRRYRRVVIDFSRRGLDGFDFAKYNGTTLVGLENLLPNAYTNAVLQMLFYVPEVKGCVLRQQYVGGEKDNKGGGKEGGLVCEMGFLFHMLEQGYLQARGVGLGLGGGKKGKEKVEEGGEEKEKEGKKEDEGEKEGEKDKAEAQAPQQQDTIHRNMNMLLLAPHAASSFSHHHHHHHSLTHTHTTLTNGTLTPLPPKPCQPSNFLRVFRHVPEVVALGLLESAKATPVAQRAEGVHRFFLTQIHSDDAATASGTHTHTHKHKKPSKEDDDDEDSQEKDSTISHLYSYRARTTNTFLHPPNLPPKTSDTRSFLLELIYPRTLGRGAAALSAGTFISSPTTSPTLNPHPSPQTHTDTHTHTLEEDSTKTKKERVATFVSLLNEATTAENAAAAATYTHTHKMPTFSQILHQSLCRETRSRGWCDVSKGYEPLKQVREMVTLPTLLALQGGVSGGSNDVARQIWHQLNALGGPWLPECVCVNGRRKTKGGVLDLVVMEKLVDPSGEGGEGGSECVWVGTADGRILKMREELEEGLAAAAAAGGGGGEGEGGEGGGKGYVEEVKKEYELVSIVSFVSSAAGGGRRGGGKGAAAATGEDGHLLLHVKVPVATQEEVEGGKEKETDKDKQKQLKWQWYIMNDFLVEPTIVEDALGFLPSWKEPCILLYRDKATSPDAHAAWLAQLQAASAKLMAISPLINSTPSPSTDTDTDTDTHTHTDTNNKENKESIPPTVFDTPSLSTLPPHSLLRTFTPLPHTHLPGKGSLLGIDAEFVALEMEKASVREDGTRVVSKEGRQALARLSILDCRTDVVMMDDYVLPSEPVMDYLTRFSGLTAEDLDPTASRHHLVTQRTAYLKLRCLIDRGVVLVGHGLKKDFRIINVFVPPQQVIDTVDLWSLEHQRKISLRFLASFLLGENIQGETHDSIEDARTAVRLYRKYVEEVEKGTFERTLSGLYEYGRKCGWKLQTSGEGGEM